MMEIERKILEIDKKKLLANIKKNKPKAKKLFEGLVRIKYFDFSDGRIRKKKDLLRLREFRGKKKTFTELTYKTFKGIKKGCKFFEEIEMKVPNGNFDEIGGLLLKVGLKETLYYEKKRTEMDCGNFKVEIDEHPKIPSFAEIEAALPEEISKAINLLGLSDFEQSAETIQELIRRKYPQVELNGLKF